MNRKIQIVSTNPSAKKQTTTLNYVNPNATDTQLRTMTIMMNALTNNTFESATKIDTTELTAKVVPTFTISPSTVALSSVQNNYISISLNYPGSYRKVSFSGKKYAESVMQLVNDNTVWIVFTNTNMTGSGTAEITITLAGNDTYEPATATFTLTGIDPDYIRDIL